MLLSSRYSRISYTAPILGGYETTADIAPGAGDWRVLAIHGAPCRPYMMARFLAEAPPDLEVVAPCRPGYGGPAWGEGARPAVPSFADQVEAFRPLIDKSDVKKTVALGISYGGALALKCALDFPHLIAGVVTVAALVTEPRPYVQSIIPWADAPPLKQALPGYLHNARVEVEARRAQIGAVFGRLKDYRRPVAILHGDLDHLVPLSDAEALRAYFAPDADVEFELVRGGSHFLELQFPGRLYAAIRRVIARAGAARSQPSGPQSA